MNSDNDNDDVAFQQLLNDAYYANYEDTGEESKQSVINAVKKNPTIIHRTGWFGHRLLMSACSGGSIELVNFLIDKGSDINARSKNGLTPIMCAARKGNIDIMNILFDKHADLNLKDYDGLTALGHGAIWGKLVSCIFLVSKGCDLMEKIKDGKSAYDLFSSNQLLNEIILEEKCKILLDIFKNGPHISQIRRRNWERRWPFMQIMTGHDIFHPILARRSIIFSKNPPIDSSKKIPNEPNSTLKDKHELLLKKVFGNVDIWRLITSFL